MEAHLVRMEGVKMNGKVLVTGTSVADELLDPLREAGLTVSNPKHLLEEPGLSDELQDSVAYLVGGDEFASDVVLERAEELKVIAFLGVGYEKYIDVSAATDRGIPVTSTPGTLTDSVTEFTIGHILNATRRISQYSRSYRAGERGTEEKQHDIAGRSVGIVGLGTIGTRVAQLLVAFGAEVSYFSRTRKPVIEASLGVEFRTLADLASSSDVLVLLVPANESTRGMIDGNFFAGAKKGMILVNTANYSVVDPAALHAALSASVLSLAAFDSFYPDSDPLVKRLFEEFSDDRLIVTGHIASLTKEARDGMAVMAVRSILNVLSGSGDPYAVNSPRTQRESESG